MNRRQFVRSAGSALLAPSAVLLLPKQAAALLVTQSGPRRRVSAGSGSGFTPDSGWSYTGSPHSTMVITKSAGGLGLPTDARALMRAPLDANFALNSDYSRLSTTMTARPGCTIVTDVKPTGAAGAARQSWPIGSAGSDDHTLFANDPVCSWSGDYVFVSVQRYYNWDNAATYNNKTIRYWGPSGAASGIPDVYVLPGSGAGASRIITESSGAWDYHDTCDAATPYYDANMAADQWYYDEHVFKESSGANFTGIVRHYRNGARAHPESVGWNTRGDSGGALTAKSTLYLDQFSNPTSTGMETGSKYLYFHDLHITDTGCFFLSSEASLTSLTMNGENDPGVKRVYQYITDAPASDMGCELDMYAGEYGATNGLYLWYRPPGGATPERAGRVNL